MLAVWGVNAAARKAIPYVSPSATIRLRRDKNKPTSMNVNVGQSYLHMYLGLNAPRMLIGFPTPSYMKVCHKYCNNELERNKSGH
jgi:hypothetical protein